MIKLVYIRGISRYDTPIFDNLQEQIDYFDDLEGVSIETYYPPHYTNVIKFETSDIDLSDMYNYLILQNGSKRYYYFIDNINYINEYVYELTITMDTIQTYMFNIVWNESLVTRKSINRYNDGKINREYIRENLSLTEKINHSYYEYKTNMGFYILVSSYNYTDIESPPTRFKQNNTYYTNGRYYYIIPLPKFEINNAYQQIQISWRVGAREIFVGYPYEVSTLLRLLVEDPYTENIYYCDNITMNELLDYSYESDDNYGYLDLAFGDKVSYATNGVMKINEIKRPAFLLNLVKNEWIEYSIPLGLDSVFAKNTNIGIDFNKRFIPQLIDENYMEILFGERICSTSYPLHKLEDDTLLYLGSSFDFLSGYRNFRITSYNDTSNNDEYITTTTSTTVQTLDLYTDAWNDYQARHKGDLTTGLKLQQANSIYNAVRGIAGSSNTSYGRNSYNTFGASSNRYFNALGGGTSSGSSFSQIKAVESITDATMSNVNFKAQLDIVKENMESTPDTSRNGNQVFNDSLTKSVSIVKIIRKCEDIESVARKLEYNGYKVCEYQNGNLFTNNDIRYYYNIIWTDYINIGLDILAPNSIVETLKARFTDGLRLWNMKHNSYITEGLKYDNVENVEV